MIFSLLASDVWGAEKCAPGYAFDEAARECIACNQPCDTGNKGICGRGLYDCSGDAPKCVSAISPGERLEICNGEDDDCDGRVDEGFDKDRDGYTTCGGDCDDRNATVHPDSVERCDAKDNNCNGLIDDGFNIGGVCVVGLGECRRQGKRRCMESGLGAECDIKPYEPGKEICDGLDNNCNGQIDDGLGEITCGIGACFRKVPACQAGAEAKCTPGKPSEEICGDKIDNNCDGKVDEGYAKLGQRCFEGIGGCKNEGKMVCDETGLGLVCSARAGEPKVEICGNRVDDDCDGEVDVDTPGLKEPCNNELLGECLREGRMVCDVRAKKLVCSAPTVRPSKERCDAKDNDCDGVIDNGVVEAKVCGRGICAGGERTRVCTEGDWGQWSECSTLAKAGEEICGNRLDDDCDGVIDRDAAGLGAPCNNGQLGACLRDGVTVCGDNAGTLVCNARMAEPGEEVCNGIDDDCDGTVDEGVTNACGGCGDLPGEIGAPCDVPGGDECAKGVFACREGAPGGMECALKPERTDGNVCSSDDNPCTVDLCRLGKCEHQPGKDGLACDDGDLCTQDDMCIAGTCKGSTNRSCDDLNVCTADLCDSKKGCYHTAIGGGIKNACGGCEVLEAPPGQSCVIGDKIGECKNGSYTCQPDGTIACVQAVFASDESCNGLDDDCDGDVDEELGITTCGIGACQITVNNCVDGKSQHCVPGDPLPETCGNNGVDDDCNGVTDDVADLGENCPFSVGTCIIPGKRRCVGDAEKPICVALNARDAEDNDGNGIANYCDHGETIAGGVDGDVGTKIVGEVAGAVHSSRLYDSTRTRAVMLPWSSVFDSAVIAPDTPEQSMLLISGGSGNEGGIAAIRTKDVTAGGPLVFRSCALPVNASPRHLIVVGQIADVIASTPKGYARYPKIASQIPSPLAGNYKCKLKGEPIVPGAGRLWTGAGDGGTCDVTRVTDIRLISEHPLAFAGAVRCSFPKKAFWKKQKTGIGIDIVSARSGGGFTHRFVPFSLGDSETGDAHIVPLPARLGGGVFVAADMGDVRRIGVCRNGPDGWRCSNEEAKVIESPIAYVGFTGMNDGPLLVIASNGAAYEAVPDASQMKVELKPAGGVSVASGRISDVEIFPAQRDRPQTLLFGRNDGIGTAFVREGQENTFLVRPIASENFAPESAVDDVLSGEKFTFGRPHAMSQLPVKRYGGKDLFAAFKIMGGSQSIGEMGFIYWNANERPGGSITDVRFNGTKGSAKLAFEDPTDDKLKYRATIRANHGGNLDNWIDGFERGRLRFSVKGDPSSVGIWPIEITVEATDTGGLAATSRVVMRRDGMVEAISESAGL